MLFLELSLLSAFWWCFVYFWPEVPGDGGSQIEARINRTESKHWWCFNHSDWFDLWLNIGKLSSYKHQCNVTFELQSRDVNMKKIFIPGTEAGFTFSF